MLSDALIYEYSDTNLEGSDTMLLYIHVYIKWTIIYLYLSIISVCLLSVYVYIYVSTYLALYYLSSLHL